MRGPPVAPSSSRPSVAAGGVAWLVLTSASPAWATGSAYSHPLAAGRRALGGTLVMLTCLTDVFPKC